MNVQMLEMMIGDLIPKDVRARIEELREGHLSSVTEIVEGQQLVIPKGMTMEAAVRVLQRKIEEDEQMVDLYEDYPYFFTDGVQAFAKTVKRVFGFSTHERFVMDGPFGPVTFAPQFMSVETAYGKKENLPIGRFSLPMVDGSISLDSYRPSRKSPFMLRLSAQIKGKCKPTWERLVAELKITLKEESILRGAAFEMDFYPEGGAMVQPRFMKLDGPEKPIFTKATDAEIENALITPIRYTDRFKRLKVPVGVKALLYGDFGTGKTLTGVKIAREAVANGWSFIHVKKCEQLEDALTFANQYAPCVVFAEDADRVMGGDRDEEMDQLSYALDGVDTKNRDVMVVLTTNKIHEIQKLMLRPGRLDAVIAIEKPDLDTVWRLMMEIAKEQLSGTKEEFLDAIKPLVGQNAAFIAEVIAKARRFSLSREEEITIRPEDVKISVDMLLKHVELMKEEEHEEKAIPLTSLYVRQNGQLENNPIVAPCEDCGHVHAG